MRLRFRHILIIAVSGVFSCKSPVDSSTQSRPVQMDKDIITDSSLNLELRDSSKLTHISGQFYKSQAGHLYQRTFVNKEVDGVCTLVFKEYFNGLLPQDIDPLSFKELDGWFAKDRNFAYYCRPTCGGILISKLENADAKSFAVLKGHYLFATDSRHVFKETQVLGKLDPSTLEITRDKDGNIIKLRSGQMTYLP